MIHLLDPGSLDPASNMALDQVLLDLDGWWLRLTRWDRPCVTLGRFQPWPESSSANTEEFPAVEPFDMNRPSTPSGRLPAIRRATGGGSILHGDDLTIAICGPCPSDVFPDRSPSKVATQISKVLCGQLSAEVAPRGGEDREKEMVDVVDCFQRRSPSDIVLKWKGQTVKAGGLALAFRPGRVLIEGSLHRGPTSRPIDDDRAWLEKLARSWLGSFGKIRPQWHENLNFTPASIDKTETKLLKDQVASAVQERFGKSTWNRR